MHEVLCFWLTDHKLPCLEHQTITGRSVKGQYSALTREDIAAIHRWMGQLELSGYGSPNFKWEFSEEKRCCKLTPTSSHSVIIDGSLHALDNFDIDYFYLQVVVSFDLEPLALKRNPGSRKEGVPPHREIQICRIRSCEAELADLRQDWEAFDKLCDALEDLREVRIRLSQESSWSSQRMISAQPSSCG